MDLAVTIVVAIVSGFGGGALAAWFNRPAAHARVAEQAAKIERRRKIVDDGRTAWRDIYPGPDGYDEAFWNSFGQDPRLLALKPHVLQHLEPGDSWDNAYDELPDLIDALEKRWNLV